MSVVQLTSLQRGLLAFLNDQKESIRLAWPATLEAAYQLDQLGLAIAQINGDLPGSEVRWLSTEAWEVAKAAEVDQ